MSETPSDQAQQLSRTQLAIILEGIADGITVLNPDGQLIYCNDAAARLMGLPDAQVLLTAPVEEMLRQFETFDESGRPLNADDLPGCLALRGISSPPQVIRFRVRATGEEHWSRVTARTVFDGAGAPILVVGIFREMTDLKRGELSQRLLAQAGMALAMPLDFETRLSNVAQLVVPDLADWCAVDMLEADGTLRRLKVVHIDPAKVALAHELYQRYPPRPDDPVGLYAVLRSGQSQFYPDLPDSFLEATITDREQLAIARQLQTAVDDDRPAGSARSDAGRTHVRGGGIGAALHSKRSDTGRRTGAARRA